LIQRNTTKFLLYSVIFNIGLLGLLDVVLNFYFVSLGNNSETIGLLQSLPRLAGFLTSVPIGLLTNRIGTRRVIIISSIGCALALWVQLIPALPMLALSRFLYGLAYGAQQIANAPLMVELTDPKERTQFFALHNFLTMVAMAFGSMIGGHLPEWIVNLTRSFAPPEWTTSATTPYAYGAAIFLAGVIGILSALPLLQLRGTLSRSAEANTHRQARHVAAPLPSNGMKIPWRLLGLAALPMLTFGFSGGLTFPFYNLFWRQEYGLPDYAVGTILSIGWIGMAILPLFNTRIEQRFGRINGLRLSMMVGAVAFAMLALQPALAISVAVFVVAISCRNMMNPLFQPLLLETLPPNLSNLASSMSMVMWNIGWFGATAMGGFVAERYGFGVIMLVVAITVLMTGFAIPLLFHQRVRTRAALIWDEATL
jgi:MFS family permease